MWGFLSKIIAPVVSFLGGMFSGKSKSAPATATTPAVSDPAGTIGSVVGNVGTSVLSGAASAIGSGVGNSVVNKVNGIPTPNTPSGAAQGAQSLDYFNTAFPGTTPWERLGSQSPMGAIASSAITSRAQMDMQQREIVSRAIQAERANEALAFGHGSPMGVKSAIEMRNASNKKVKKNMGIA